MKKLDEHLKLIQEKYQRVLPHGLKTYDGIVDDAMLKDIVKICKGIIRELQVKFKQLKPKYYKEKLSYLGLETYYEDWHEPGSLRISFAYGMEWNLWGKPNGDDSVNDACHELVQIEKELLLHINKKFHFVPGNNLMHEVDDLSVLLKNGKILMSIGAEGDKCEDLYFWINIYGSNVESYDGLDFDDLVKKA